MTQPIATAHLSGIPRAGTLVLPAPRPMYVLEVVRLPKLKGLPDYAKLVAKFEATAVYTRLLLVSEGVDADGVSNSFYWHGEAHLDGYQWRVRANENMRELQLFDDLKQRTRRWSYEAA